MFVLEIDPLYRIGYINEARNVGLKLLQVHLRTYTVAFSLRYKLSRSVKICHCVNTVSVKAIFQTNFT